MKATPLRMRFSLRLLLIGIAVCAGLFAWLGHEWRTVNERQALRAWIAERRQQGHTTSHYARNDGPKVMVAKLGSTDQLRTTLRWFGEQPTPKIWLNIKDADDARVRQIAAAFPEAIIFTVDRQYRRGPRLP